MINQDEQPNINPEEENSKPEPAEIVNAEKASENLDANGNTVQENPTGKNKKADKKKQKFSGAYWYVQKEDAEIAKQSFNRTLLVVIGFLFEVVVLLFPQEGLQFVTEKYPSYAYVYMWMIFIMIGVFIYTAIMYLTRYKLQKRIPVEYAPKKGFKYRTFLCGDILAAVFVIVFAMELSFVIMDFDGFGLAGVFLCAAAVGAAVWSRMIALLTLRDAEFIDQTSD